MKINMPQEVWDSLSEREKERIIRRKVLKRIGWSLLPIGFLVGLIFCAYINVTIGLLLSFGTMITGIILVFWNLGTGIGRALGNLGRLAEKNSDTDSKKTQSQKGTTPPGEVDKK